MLFNLKTVKHAFDNAAEGKHYLNQEDLEVFFIEVFGQRPSERLLSRLCDEFDVRSAETPVGVSLPKIISYLRDELGCNLNHNEGPNEDEYLALFQALDTRGSNFIMLKDFVERVKSRLMRGSLRSAFRIFDVDGDGRVSYRDFIEGIRAGHSSKL